MLQEKPMRLCYQIFERTVIQVPLVVENKISDAYTPPKNNFVTDSSTSSSSLNNSSESSKIEDEQPLTSTLSSPSKNLKRKCDSLSETMELSGSANKDFIRGLELKIPRISVDVLPARPDEPKGELKASDSCTSLCSESGLKAPIKTPSNDSGTYSDDYVKYEEDIEEVDDDDDDDEDRLRISQLSDEEMPLDEKVETAPVKQELVVDTSTVDKDDADEDLAKEQEDKKAAKYRRKNKKSKHHHHRRHHHRHHDRKKPPQATILHSPDTDIMKLKVKLNTIVPSADSKHHKQSRRKRRRSPEAYFSSSPSSRASSVTASSPDHGNSISRADEDSLHSHISEISTESVDTTTSSKEELPKVSEVVPLPTPTPAPAQSPPVRAQIPEEPAKEQSSPGTKEKLLQMRAFRPKSIAVVKPEESDKKIVPVDPAKMMAALKNDDNNNKHEKVPTQIVDKPVSTPILRPASSSSITVSKITAAEKMLMEKEKRMNVANEERPSLEITLVSEPTRSSGASSPSTTYSDSVSTTTAKVKHTVPRIMKPLPALVQLPATKSATKSVSIFPCGKHIQQRSVKSSANTDVAKKVNETMPIIKTDGMKQSVTISLSGNHFGNDLIPGALDLSGKQCTGKIIDKTTMSKNAAAMAAAQVNIMQQHAKKAYIQPYGAASPQPQLPPTSLPYNPVTSMASLAESRRLAQTLASKEAAAQFQYMFGSGGGLPFPVMQSPKHSHTNHRMYTSSPRTSPNAQVITLPLSAANSSLKMGKVSGMPALNEIKIGPVSSTAEATPQHKPGPNQNIRNIPNPSRLLRRQQPVGSVGPMAVGALNGAANKCTSNVGMSIVNNRLASIPCSFTNHKKNGEKCLQTVLPKGYLDHSSIMATK